MTQEPLEPGDLLSKRLDLARIGRARQRESAAPGSSVTIRCASSVEAFADSRHSAPECIFSHGRHSRSRLAFLSPNVKTVLRQTSSVVPFAKSR